MLQMCTKYLPQGNVGLEIRFVYKNNLPSDIKGHVRNCILLVTVSVIHRCEQIMLMGEQIEERDCVMFVS
jgi:hypothetical protein